ncbi:MAG TPA: leishmanolysin-related zinc metalloendopeptidase [Gemmatimonadaceae bacterium]
MKTGIRQLSGVILVCGVALAGACSDSSGPAPASAYKIDLRFFGRTLTASQQALFTNAKARLESIITGTVPPVNANGADPATCGATGVAKLTETISGLVIYASIDSIDGRGKILAEAGPCYIRTSNGQNDYRTSIGIIKIDSADINTLAGSGNLQQVITHEMMHVVGFGTFWDSTSTNLLINYGSNVSYIGAGGIAGCRAIGGNSICASSVPVEGSQGSEGTINSHWRESTFGNELMTGFLNSGTNPLSIMSIRSLEDLGYTVNSAVADAYPDANTHVVINLRSILDPNTVVAAPTPTQWEEPPPHPVGALPVIGH